MKSELNMKHKPLTKKEEERAIIQILEVLLDNSVPFSGAHRKKQWEKGWGENLESGNGVPKYFGKYPIQRLNGKFVRGIGKNYERDMLYTLVDSLAKKYLSKVSDVYEFGCGTGHNLWRVKAINKKATLHGFDWTKSSNEIIKGRIGNGLPHFLFAARSDGIIVSYPSVRRVLSCATNAFVCTHQGESKSFVPTR
jgi:hypothetical protein